jgi:hypothetical protein
MKFLEWLSLACVLSLYIIVALIAGRFGYQWWGYHLMLGTPHIGWISVGVFLGSALIVARFSPDGDSDDAGGSDDEAHEPSKRRSSSGGHYEIEIMREGSFNSWTRQLNSCGALSFCIRRAQELKNAQFSAGMGKVLAVRVVRVCDGEVAETAWFG